MALRSRSSRLVFVLVAAVLLLVVLPTSAHAVPQIEIPTHNGLVTPGDTMRIESSGWGGKMGGCDNKVKFRIVDSAGKSFTIGNFAPKFSLFENEGPYFVYVRSASVPNGIKPGAATLKAYQSWEVGFGGVCIRLFEHDARRPIVIDGAAGNSPPVITQLAAPEVKQGVGTPITWTASEACAMTLTFKAEVRPGDRVEIGNLTTGLPGTQGANTYTWDGSVNGSYVPPGTHRIKAQCTDASASRSAPVFTNVKVTYP